MPITIWRTISPPTGPRSPNSTDGYEVTDKNAAVIATGERGVSEAIFLRSFTKHATLVSPDPSHTVTSELNRTAGDAQIEVVDRSATGLSADHNGIKIRCGGSNMSFASAYPALGSDINNMLVKMAGGKTNEAGCILVDPHQRTSVPSLYAAGDVVIGLDQISHAMGEGGVAATTMPNGFAKQHAMRR